MKNFMLVTVASVTLSCNNKIDKVNHSADPITKVQQKIKSDFSKINFASTSDSTCGMPLSAGIEDTTVIGNKVYGFCSKGCKDEFLKIHITSLNKK
ncbi:MAG TPA: hypothetical protein PKM63_13655 [Panacibacter sp.]|nr:hypothetical protein [Panacibacter sp.]HNP45330.1 hypothetical protein [Panacibacter sp.]